MKQLILIATLLFAAPVFAADFTYECIGEKEVAGQKALLRIEGTKALLQLQDGSNFEGTQDTSYVPRSRKNYTRFDVKDDQDLLVEQALLHGGYSIKEGSGGHIQTEFYQNDNYVRGNYFCKRK